MKTKHVADHIINWLNTYVEKSNLDGFVIGVSGGVDSALTSTLCANTGKPTLCLEMPIHQERNQDKKAPLIIKDNMIENMQSGSVIYDLAAIQGGNTAFTEVDKIIEKNGVKIMGESNILNKLPVSASNLYAKNVFNFIDNLIDKENKKININLEDEIIEKTLIK